MVFLKVKIEDFEIEVKVNRQYPILDDELKFSTKLLEKNQTPRQFSKDRAVEYIDYDKIQGQLRIRNFRTGDRFRPLNSRGQKKLSDYFTDKKIPLHKRREIPLLVCDYGIVWIMGFQIDDRFKITSETKQILRLQLQKEATA